MRILRGKCYEGIWKIVKDFGMEDIGEEMVGRDWWGEEGF